MSFKILLRGGIVIGDLIHNDKLLLGPGMVAAYELESKCAFSPRIVIDPKVAYRFRIVKNRLFAPEINEKRIIHKDMDDTCYIDYFNVDNSVLADEDQFEYFKLLCQMVANNVSSSEMSIRMKYLWMRNKIKNSEMYKRPGYAEIYKQIVTDNKK